jgi:DNA-binding NarL/FixJ family response regulator
MPGKNGIDAMKEILSLDKNAKVLICSGSGYDDDVNFAFKVGARCNPETVHQKEVAEIINSVEPEITRHAWHSSPSRINNNCFSSAGFLRGFKRVRSFFP